MSLDQNYSTSSYAPERQRTGRSASRSLFTEAAAVAHDVFWFAVLPLSFIFAPLIAFAGRILLPVETFSAAGLTPHLAGIVAELNAGLFLFCLSGWLVLVVVWFFRAPDPDRSLNWYARKSFPFPVGLYLWAAAPTVMALLTAVFTNVFTKGS